MGGGKQKMDLPATPAPTPMPLPTSTDPVTTESERANRVRNMRAGIMSTIKTSPAGVSGTGSDLTQGQGNKTLGGK